MANEDSSYLSRIRKQDCQKCGRRPCQAHHRTGAGMALRAHDHETISLCVECHASIHELTHGEFSGWTKGELREWQREAVESNRRRFGLEDGDVM